MLLAQIAIVLISSTKISLGKHAFVIQLYVFARLRCQIRRKSQALPCIFLLTVILQGHLSSPLIATVQGNLGLDGLYEFGNTDLSYETSCCIWGINLWHGDERIACILTCQNVASLLIIQNISIEEPHFQRYLIVVMQRGIQALVVCQDAWTNLHGSIIDSNRRFKEIQNVAESTGIE